MCTPEYQLLGAGPSFHTAGGLTKSFWVRKKKKKKPQKSIPGSQVTHFPSPKCRPGGDEQMIGESPPLGRSPGPESERGVLSEGFPCTHILSSLRPEVFKGEHPGVPKTSERSRQHSGGLWGDLKFLELVLCGHSAREPGEDGMGRQWALSGGGQVEGRASPQCALPGPGFWGAALKPQKRSASGLHARPQGPPSGAVAS
jgi:hypothetical protein